MISGTHSRLWIVRNALLVPVGVGLVALFRQRLDSRMTPFIVVALSLFFWSTPCQPRRRRPWLLLGRYVRLRPPGSRVGLDWHAAPGRHAGALGPQNLPQNHQPGIIATALRRFSLVAVISIALLLFTGVVNSAIELGGLIDLTSTGYGLTLLIKLILLLPLLFAGGLNAYLFRPQVVEEAERAETSGRSGLSEGWEKLGGNARSHGANRGMACGARAPCCRGAGAALADARCAGRARHGGQVHRDQTGRERRHNAEHRPEPAGKQYFETYLTGDAGTVERVRLLFLENKKGAFQSELVLDQSPDAAVLRWQRPVPERRR